MTWIFDVVASNRPRVYSRILQLLEEQVVRILSFKVEQTSDVESNICFIVSPELNKAYRIQVLIGRLQDVISSEVRPTLDCLECPD